MESARPRAVSWPREERRLQHLRRFFPSCSEKPMHLEARLRPLADCCQIPAAPPADGSPSEKSIHPLNHIAAIQCWTRFTKCTNATSSSSERLRAAYRRFVTLPNIFLEISMLRFLL